MSSILLVAVCVYTGCSTTPPVRLVATDPYVLSSSVSYDPHGDDSGYTYHHDRGALRRRDTVTEIDEKRVVQYER